MRLPWNENKVRLKGVKTWWGGPVYWSKEKVAQLGIDPEHPHSGRFPDEEFREPVEEIR